MSARGTATPLDLPGKGDGLRLHPPYREHLSQAFARFFLRVGLAGDIPPLTS